MLRLIDWTGSGSNLYTTQPSRGVYGEFRFIDHASQRGKVNIPCPRLCLGLPFEATGLQWRPFSATVVFLVDTINTFYSSFKINSPHSKCFHCGEDLSIWKQRRCVVPRVVPTTFRKTVVFIFTVDQPAMIVRTVGKCASSDTVTVPED